MANIDFPTAPTTGQRYTFAGITYVFTAQGVWSPGISVVTQIVPQGRLTLQSGVPVMTTTSSGHTSLFYTPYFGNKVPIWNGGAVSTMAVISCLPELIASTVDTTKSPGPLVANKLNDWFIWNDAGTVRLSHGPDWTNDTTRQDALARVEGILLNTVAITNGPAAPGVATGQRSAGTYVGTTISNASAQLDWIYGGRATPPIAGWFGIWNMYNRAQLNSLLGEMTGSWTYSSNVPRQINGQANAKFTFVSGMAEDNFTGTTNSNTVNGAGGEILTGVGYDSITALSGTLGYGAAGASATQGVGQFTTAALGKHFMANLEVVDNNGVVCTCLGGDIFGGAKSGMWFEGRF